MAGKKSSQKSKLIHQKRTEAKTRHPRGNSKILAQFDETAIGKREGNCDCDSHAHHSDHGSDTEDEQVDSCPGGAVNRRQHKKRYGCRTSQSMNQTDDQRSQALIETEAAYRLFEPPPCSCSAQAPPRSCGRDCGNRRREVVRHLLQDAGEVQNSQQNEHDCDAEFHGKAQASWNLDSEKNDERTDDENGDGVSQSPDGPDERRIANAALPADDG